MSTGLVARIAALGAALGLAASCADEASPPVGQIMLAIQTDMSIPKDIDSIGIEITSKGETRLSREYPVGGDTVRSVRIPATLGIVAGEDPNRPVAIRVYSRQKGEIRTLRDVVTTVPEDRIVALRIPVEWLCDDSGRENGKVIEGRCGKGKTCVAGACVGSTIDSTKLPDFRPEDVFGGAPEPGPEGDCFDTVGCFAKGESVAVDSSGCAFEAPNGGSLSVGLVMPPGSDGICSDAACVIPLDGDGASGWHREGRRVVLPRAVCDRLDDGRVSAVAITSACAPKTGAVPTCGSWSSVTSRAGATSGAAPAGVSFDAGTDGGGPLDGGKDARDASAPSDASADTAPPSDAASESEAGAAAIGPAGGTVASADGVVVVEVPPDALTETILVSVVPAESGYPAGAVGKVYEIGPDGYVFKTPVKVSYSWDGFDGGSPKQFAELASAAQKDPAWQVLSKTSSDDEARALRGETTHFSFFAPVLSPSDAGPPDVSIGDAGPDVVDAGACVGLACQVVACDGGATTSISGTVTIPAGTLPIPNAVVYVPLGAVAPFTSGATCDPCGQPLSGGSLVSAVTDHTGSFSLLDAPAGSNIPLVIQIGKWRRQIVIPTVAPCVDTPLAPALTSLPTNKAEGDIPKIALTTGGGDAVECLLRKIGIADSEFSTDAGTGRVHLYAGTGGATQFDISIAGGASFGAAATFWGSLANLSAYDAVLLTCEGSQDLVNKPSPALQAMQDYLNLGGRVFAEHFQSVWLEQGPAPFPTVATFNAQADIGAITADVDMTFPKGAAFAQWLVDVGASAVLGQINVSAAKHTIDAVNAALATRWIYTTSPVSIQVLSANTPMGVPPASQCGRIVQTDFHVSSGDSFGPPFPQGCSSSGFTPEEKAMVFLLFDVATCI